MKSYKFTINGNQYNVEVNAVSGNIADVTVNGTPYQVEMEEAPSVPSVSVQTVQSAAKPSAPATVPQPNAKPAPSGAGKAVKSPLPGVILSINVNVGDAVKAGQTVAVLEAMKMENDIQAEFDGTVTAINAAKGDSVLEGAAIVTLG